MRSKSSARSLAWIGELSMEERAELAAQVKPRRLALGLTQEQLASQSSVSLRTLVSLENGASVPQAESLKSLAFILGLQPEEEGAEHDDRGIEGWLSGLRALLQGLPPEHQRRVMGEAMRVVANAATEQRKSDRERMIENFG